MIIYKEQLPVDTLFPEAIKLPFDSVEDAVKHILKVDIQHGVPVMWYQADDDSNGEIGDDHDFIIQAIGTGHPYTGEDYREIINKSSYIGTAQLYEGALVLHYFIAFIISEDE